MNRRDALKRAALALGGVISAPTLSAFLSGCATDPTQQAAARKTFTTTQHDLVAAFSERIIPTTDTPGAVDAGVPDFIDLMVGEWQSAAYKERFLEGLEATNDFCEAEHGAAFATCSPEQQDAVLTALAAEHQEATGRPSPRAWFFMQMREMTLLGYYTSEVGATQELRVNPMGQWDGDVPFADVGRSYAL